MHCIGCHKELKKGDFVTLNGGAMVKTKTGSVMGDKNLLGFLTVNNHFDSKKNYRSLTIAMDKPNGQFEFYACSHKCLAKSMTRSIMLLEKLDKIKKFEIATSSNVKRLGIWVERVLKLIGFSKALVTDESSIFDFCSIELDEDGEEKLFQKWSKKIGFKVDGKDRIWTVADKLSKRFSSRYKFPKNM